jgi:Putative phage serine protease XkdF
MDIQKTYWSNNESSMALAFPISKVNKEKRTVSGFASLDNVDRHGDVVTAEANKKAFERFRGNIREMHGPSAVGKMLKFKEDNFFDPETNKKYNGIYVTAYISKGAQDAWEKVLDGTYSGFSIGGNINSAKMEKADDGSGKDRRVIHDYDLHELSLVDSPANQLANFFSIEKNVDGSTFVKGMVADVVLENVFWCKNDEIASTSTATTKDCVVCDTKMENIGWVEQSDSEKFEAIEKVIDSYFTKDNAPDSNHSATTHDSDPQNVVSSDQTINLYPDQNTKQKVLFHDGTKLKKSEEISLNKGGNKMAEDTNTTIESVEATATIEKSIDVETPAEEVSTVETIAEDTSIEKAVSLSEVEDALDLTKMVSDLKTFFGESIEKNYATHAATVQDMYNIVNETRAEMARLSKGYEDIQKANADLVAKYEELNKSVTDMFGKIEYVDHQLKGFESATAVQKSFGVEAPSGQTKPKQSIWQGAFLSASSI